MIDAALRQFAAEYGRHRAAEGRGYSEAELLALPWLASGPHARQWAVRARTFEAFLARELRPLARRLGRPLGVLDLGAGCGWLSYRVAREGHTAVALDLRDDAVDGLGAAAAFLRRQPGRITPVLGSFDQIPCRDASADLAVFNAAIHYALDLHVVLREAARVVRPGGRLVILDSPFYARDLDGELMVAEKRLQAGERFGASAGVLLAPAFIEFLTRERLASASAGLGLAWRRRRVAYPLWYELRPLKALFAAERPPSRFDLWASARP